MTKKFALLFFLLILLFSSCTSKNNREAIAQEQATEIPIRKNEITVQDKITPSNTPSPEHIGQSPAKSSTITATLDLHCDEPQGYAWSQVFSTETASITGILSIAEDSFILNSSLDSYDGTILIKINADGEVSWQKKIPSFFGDLELAPNGNILLVNSGGTIELDEDANILQTVNTYAYLPQKDGGITLAKAGEVIHFNQSENPQWAYTFNSPDTFIALTQDGGAIAAYAGAYADQSVYYAPIYTDIKINKIDANGQIWQRTYGKLIGDETLDYVGATNDGGSILAGTHTYEELGSDYDIWIMKVNQTGAMSWQTTLKHTPESDYITGITLVPKGIVILSEDLYTGDLRLVKLSNNGSLVWQKEMTSIRGPIIVNTIDEMDDGSILLSGETREKTSINFLTKFDVKGNIVWEKLIGFDSIENVPANYIETIYAMNNGDILIAGSSNLLGMTMMDKYGGWIARIEDKGASLKFLSLSPGKFSIITTLSSRPNNLPDDITPISTVAYASFDVSLENINLSTYPACLAAGMSYPTPQAIPTLTPSLTPTLVFQRDLYLTQPENMQGDDVLILQQRLLALGYSEVGTPDGIFGKMTDNAVRLFQENNGLEVDGYVGPITWKTLFSDMAVRK